MSVRQRRARVVQRLKKARRARHGDPENCLQRAGVREHSRTAHAQAPTAIIEMIVMHAEADANPFRSGCAVPPVNYKKTTTKKLLIDRMKSGIKKQFQTKPNRIKQYLIKCYKSRSHGGRPRTCEMKAAMNPSFSVPMHR